MNSLTLLKGSLFEKEKYPDKKSKQRFEDRSFDRQEEEILEEPAETEDEVEK